MLHHHKIRLLASRSLEVLGGMIRDRVPENGHICPLSVSYSYPGRNIRGIVMLEQDGRDPSLGRIRFGMVPGDSDRMVSNYLFKGTRQEILEYLEDPATLEILLDADARLLEKV